MRARGAAERSTRFLGAIFGTVGNGMSMGTALHRGQAARPRTRPETVPAAGWRPFVSNHSSTEGRAQHITHTHDGMR